MTPLEVLQAYVAGNGYEVLGDAVVPMRNEEAEAALVAVLNLIEAAQHYREVVDRMVTTQDPAELKPAWERFTDAHDVFVSGQEEPNG